MNHSANSEKRKRRPSSLLAVPVFLLRRIGLIISFVTSFIVSNTIHRLYVFYCEHLRPYPTPCGPHLSEDTDVEERAERTSRAGCGNRVPAVDNVFVADKQRRHRRAQSLIGKGKGGSLQTLLDGSRLAHNTHFTCVRNRVPAPPAREEGAEVGVGASGGGFFLVPEEENEGKVPTVKTNDRTTAPDKTISLTEGATGSGRKEDGGLLFASLDEAILHAHRTAMLLVVYLHSEVSATSQTLLREIVVHNTANIQRFLSYNVVFYLLSASSSEASGLLQLYAMGQAFPSILVFNTNQLRRDEDRYRPDGSEELAAVAPRRRGIRFVSSMEGVGCVADLLSYLRECEKRYMSWL